MSEVLNQEQRDLLKGGIRAMENQVDKIQMYLIMGKDLTVTDLQVIQYLIIAVIGDDNN